MDTKLMTVADTTERFYVYSSNHFRRVNRTGEYRGVCLCSEESDLDQGFALH